MSADSHSQSEIIAQIAAETQTPHEQVEKDYVDSVNDLSDGARVRDYISLFATKRVKNRIRERRKS